MSETTPQEAAPLDVIGRYLDVMRSGDRETGYTFFAEDVSFHIPGRSPFAGDHRGRDAAVHYIESAIALAQEGEVELELIDTLASRERVALLLHERFKRPDGVSTSAARTSTGSPVGRSWRSGSSKPISTRSTPCSARRVTSGRLRATT